jgi:hypothetical protein
VIRRIDHFRFDPLTLASTGKCCFDISLLSRRPNRGTELALCSPQAVCGFKVVSPGWIHRKSQRPAVSLVTACFQDIICARRICCRAVSCYDGTRIRAWVEESIVLYYCTLCICVGMVDNLWLVQCTALCWFRSLVQRQYLAS